MAKIAEKQKKVTANSLRQMRTTVRATLLTLVLGAVLAFEIPQVRDFLFRDPPTSRVRMEFATSTSNPSTVALLFYCPFASASASDASLAAEQCQDFSRRVEFLGRRFARGNFDMLSLPLLRNQPFSKVLAENSQRLAVQTEWSAKASVAKIKMSVSPSASRSLRLALLEYAGYLQKNWVWSISSPSGSH